MVFDLAFDSIIWTNVWVMWTVYATLLIGGLAHVFPQILGKLSTFKPLNKKIVRGIQVAIGIVLIIYFAMLWMA